MDQRKNNLNMSPFQGNFFRILLEKNTQFDDKNNINGINKRNKKIERRNEMEMNK